MTAAYRHVAPDEGISMAQEVLDRAQSRGADAVELFLHDASEAAANLVPETKTLAVSGGGGFAVAARVWHGGTCGFAARHVCGAADLADLVDEARYGATHYGRAKAIPAAGVRELRTTPPGRAPEPDSAASRAREMASELAARQARVQAVLVREFLWWTAVLSSTGTSTCRWVQQLTSMVRCETNCGAVVDALNVPDLDHWEPASLLDRVGDAMASLDAKGADLPAGLPVVMRPTVAGSLVAALGWLLSGRTALDVPGLRTAIGRRIFPQVLSVEDDPVAPDGLNQRKVDDEGAVATCVTCVHDGTLREFLLDADTAQRFEMPSNGRGIRLGIPSEPAPTPVNLRVLPRGTPLPPDYVELSCKVETMTSMPRAGLVSMVAGGWVCRDGARVTRLRPTPILLPVLESLRRLRGVCDDLTMLATAGSCGTPSLLFDPSVLTQ